MKVHRFIQETLERDRAMFKPIAIVNSFLTDITSEATGSGNNDEGAQAASTTGSMQEILGTI